MKVVRVPEWIKRPGGPISANSLAGWPTGVRFDGADRRSKPKKRRLEVSYEARAFVAASLFALGVDLL